MEEWREEGVSWPHPLDLPHHSIIDADVMAGSA